MIFLGNIFSTDRISANLEKIDKVKSWPVSKSTNELHSSMGMAPYFHWFIPSLAHVGKCLYQIMGPNNVKKYKS